MKRPVRQADGCYYIDGKKYKELFGSREQVMNGTAYKTAGELKKEDFVVNKKGRIVIALKYKTAKKEMRLDKYGYVKIPAKNRTKKNITRNDMKGGDCGCGAKPKLF